MKKFIILVSVFVLNFAATTFAQTNVPRARIETMFKAFKPGEMELALDAFAKDSLVPKNIVSQAKSDAKAAITLETPIIGFEFLQEQNVGESVKRFSYVMKLSDRPLYWNFTFYKQTNAWVPLRMSFVEEP